ncbi:MAG TPA: hypothetical protein VJT10_22820 [Steroidobacteraceae bacterium]|nr:hypothetical protein [Steroidobacteraceae bacterium]
MPAIALAAVLHVISIRKPDYWQVRGTRAAVRAIAAASLLLWTGVVFAGRWIAYADYLFPE